VLGASVGIVVGASDQDTVAETVRHVASLDDFNPEVGGIRVLETVVGADDVLEGDGTDLTLIVVTISDAPDLVLVGDEIVEDGESVRRSEITFDFFGEPVLEDVETILVVGVSNVVVEFPELVSVRADMDGASGTSGVRMEGRDP
jgi:hypothetical protein